MLDNIVEKCAGNSICIVEEFKLRLDEGYSPTQDEVKYVSALLGESTKKVEVLKSKYIDVFTRLVEKNCSYVGDESLCIYTWNPKIPVRYFPVSLDATGTVLHFSKSQVSLVAYPAHRSYDLESGGVEVPDPEKVRVVEVTSRVDGYQITFYFNNLLKRWVPATRYVLHNMRYVRNRLVEEDLANIINPYAAVADHIAWSRGLYERIKDMVGWTFTFVLKAPEPAILKPNVELYSYEDFKLYLINAREPGGRLLTTEESSQLVRWESVPVEKIEVGSASKLKELVNTWSADIYVRSRFLRFASRDPVRPYVVEVRSKLYENAVLVKYSSDPKSLIVLASHGLGGEGVKLLTDYRDVRAVGREICELYQELRDIVSQLLSSAVIEEIMRDLKLSRDLFGELEKARRSGGLDRFTRKLSLAVSSENIYETRDKLRALVEELKRRSRSHQELSKQF
ncbi:MAG: hypothetical protein RMH84_01970 [Sulfolobales archaeon]|nr:hypothetical protein [Sulfolobales archaeon]MCX8208078.1 hypothetical protein [Sulfolobales archaeon]MDW8010344.1 hypothetical protein [Sulfolobales archaeon]